ncbi:alkaline phosphatase [Geodermatophilus sp. SYSU D00079]
MRRRAAAVLALLLALPACQAGSPAADRSEPPGRPTGAEPTERAGPTGDTGAPDAAAPSRSVILVVGDGMAAAHREAGRLDQEGTDGQLAMDALPVRGEQTTDPADGGVTDSAAAASAWATGRKTATGAISVDADGDPLPTLGAEAAAAGKATGLVTTAEVTDATPAAFFSNVDDRGEDEEIARQYVEVTHPSVVLGGGADTWESGDLAGEALDSGYGYVTDAEGLAAADGGRLLGLFADEEMYGEGRPEVSLATMTTAALEVLAADEDGFFLLVEEEGVDGASHDNDDLGLLEAMRSLDDAVEVARDFVATHPDTLLIVTGDHETGGLTVDDGGRGDLPVAGGDGTFRLSWDTGGHTGEPVPVTAEGPGSEQLTGTYPNTHLHEVMRSALLG